MTAGTPDGVGMFDGTSEEWDTYVRSHPEGRFCHLQAYQDAILATYGFPTLRFGIRREGRLRGVIAVAACRSLLFGVKWVSMPYSEYGGFLVDDDARQDDVLALIASVRAAAVAGRVGVVEVNGLLGLPDSDVGRFVPAIPYECAVLDLGVGARVLVENVFKREVRKALRKAERAGLVTREASDAATILNHFYPLWLDGMRRLGVPPHGAQYFLELKRRFGSDLGIVWTERAGRPIAALLGIKCGSRVQIIATASDPKDWEDRPNDLAHWGYIERACSDGARWFDFGSVRYQGQRHYKEKWGAAFRPAAHWVDGVRKGARPGTFDSSSGALDAASWAWRTLVPASAARRLGPIVRRMLLR